MNQLTVLLPGTAFFSQDGKSNFNTLVFTVPSDRDKSDPFYVVPEIETDQFIYWTGADTQGKNTQYFFKKP